MERHILSYEINEVTPYINWIYFFHAWQVKDKAEQDKIRNAAIRRLKDCEGRYQTHAVFALGNANSDGDDILFNGKRLPMLRQQRPNKGLCLCLADFIRPLSSGNEDIMGLFATSTDNSMEHDFDGDDYEATMHKLLADRLAEATAELMHEQVRKRYWGYAPHESLTIEALHGESFDGIRPAVGYPALPDMSINFILDDILHLNDIGITLTENGAMRPHASVSGLMISHPKARYFNIDGIGEDQLHDYARRRDMDVQTARHFLGSILK